MRMHDTGSEELRGCMSRDVYATKRAECLAKALVEHDGTARRETAPVATAESI